jgi:hypothetical protein
MVQANEVAEPPPSTLAPPGEDLYLDLLKKCLCASIYDESAWIIWGQMSPTNSKMKPLEAIKEKVKLSVRQMLKKRSLFLVKHRRFNAREREEGLDWPSFGYTMVGRRRLDNVHACVEDVLARGVPGDLIETGVWRGGTTILMRAILKKHGITDRSVWCADSFEGLPPPSAADLAKQPDSETDLTDLEYLAVSLEQVQANFERFGLLDDQVKFLKGWFCDTLPTAPVGQIAVLRMDGDLYSSTMDTLNNLYAKMSPGGFVIVDDYHSWPSCKAAVDEYRQAHGITSPIIDIDPHSVYWKVPTGE